MRISDRIIAAAVTGATGASVAGYLADQPGVFVGAVVAAAAVGATGVAGAVAGNLRAEPRPGRYTVGDVIDGEFTETHSSKDLVLSQVRGGA